MLMVYGGNSLNTCLLYTSTVTWTAVTGVGVSAEATEAQGSIEVEFTPEIVEAMQTGNVLVAVVSAA